MPDHLASFYVNNIVRSTSRPFSSCEVCIAYLELKPNEVVDVSMACIFFEPL